MMKKAEELLLLVILFSNKVELNLNLQGDNMLL